MNSTPDRQETAIDRLADELVANWTTVDSIIEPDASVETLPANGQPVNLAEVIDHESLAYRAWQTPIGDFLASQMERLAQLIRFTGATTPSEFADRLEVLDQEAREQHFDVGYEEGREAPRHFA